MAEGLVDMSQQFGNLPMESLIGGPLQAAAKANAQMVMTNAQFIIDTGFQKDENGNPTKANMVEFAFEQNIAQTAEDGTVTMVPQEVKVKAPMLAILPLPALKVTRGQGKSADARYSAVTCTQGEGSGSNIQYAGQLKY
jgi:hypothetical protein